MILTTLGRLGPYGTLRSSTVARPRRAASLRAIRALVCPTPARAAISGMVRLQNPCERTSSATIRRTACSPTVNRLARGGEVDRRRQASAVAQGTAAGQGTAGGG